MPIILFSPLDPAHAGLIAMLAAAGALDELGMKNARIWGTVGDHRTLAKIVDHARAVYAVSKLKGRVLGLFGGRPMGFYIATTDPAQIHSIFGVDIEHIDQLEIVNRAEKMPANEVEKGYRWLQKKVLKIDFDQNKLTEAKLCKQIASYVATKEIVRERGLDFLAVKCHPELSGGYCTQCLTQAFMNDPYDWDGKKQIVPTACEADVDAAVTMEILHLLTGKPVTFFDLRHFSQSDKLLTFMNCGSQSTWFASKSDNASENLRLVSLCPQIFDAGGASLQFQCSPGDITLARLSRIRGRYVMQIALGEFVRRPVEEMENAVYGWPQGFVRLKSDPEDLLRRLPSNHMHAVYGDWANELIEVSNYLSIQSTVFA
jgi:L-fucose isomerase